jgi:uncharacterized phage protein (TIGR02216 family)
MNRSAGAFPWPVLMQFGLGVLRLAPRDFWSLSLPELYAAMQAHYRRLPVPITRVELEQLMRDHPDLSEENT